MRRIAFVAFAAGAAILLIGVFTKTTAAVVAGEIVAIPSALVFLFTRR